MKRVQRFDFRLSRYERPNQKWVCGRKDCGEACPLGPDDRGKCRATAECQPLKTGDRWFCTRAEVRGGKCPEGPLPDGSCCRAIPKCLSKRSVRARRGLTVLLTVAATLGAVLLLLGTSRREQVFSPGPLTAPHASEDINCASCHSSASASSAGWIQAAFRRENVHSDSQHCLDCHNLGDHAMQPHGLATPDRAALTAAVAAVPAHGGRPIAGTMATLLGAPPSDAEGNLACGTCHREHHGVNFDLTKLTTDNCNSCHAVKFDSFAHGHPDFRDYPYKRRTRIAFDHNGHINSYFTDAANQAKAPAQCNDCHVPDADNRLMLARNFEATCAACHLENIVRADSKGLEVLRIPGLDKKFLAARKGSIGQWPEEADGGITPFMQFFLNRDEKTAAALASLKDADLLDLASASPAVQTAAEQVAWGIKQLAADLIVAGHKAAQDRLGDSADATLGQLSLESASAFTRPGWWPALLSEVAAHRAGRPLPAAVPLPSNAPSSPQTSAAKAVVKPPTQTPKAAPTDDILGNDPAPEPAASNHRDESDPSPAAAVEESKAIASEEWVSTGGWHVAASNFTLYYRPHGHADPFLKAWLDLGARGAADPRLAEAFRLIGEQSNCLKCHSVDAVGGGALRVNWESAAPTPHRHQFTKFSHGAHFSLLDEKGCQTCHQINPEAEFLEAFKNNTDPAHFVSSFEPLQNNICARCHNQKAGGGDCQVCHLYHVGEFAPTISKAARSQRMQLIAAPAADSSAGSEPSASSQTAEPVPPDSATSEPPPDTPPPAPNSVTPPSAPDTSAPASGSSKDSAGESASDSILP